MWRRQARAGLGLIAGAAFMISCSSSSGGPAFTDAVWQVRGSADEFELDLATYANWCTMSNQTGVEVANTRELQIKIVAPAGQSTVPAGTYPVADDDGPGVANIQSKSYDGACNDIKTDATGGMLTLATVLGSGTGTVGGSYSAQFADGSSLSGDFTASFCQPPADTNGSTCVQ